MKKMDIHNLTGERYKKNYNYMAESIDPDTVISCLIPSVYTSGFAGVIIHIYTDR